jgi:DNA-binding response OmpR family regulator
MHKNNSNSRTREPYAYRILVAESDTDISQMLMLLLSREGFETTITSSGTAALDLAQMESFDLVLLDLDIPDVPAFSLCSRLRANPVTEKLPVVISSAWPGVGGLATKAGAVGYLEKPLDFLHLSELLRQILRHQPTAKT